MHRQRSMYKSIREKKAVLSDYKHTVQSQARQGFKTLRRMPRWLHIMKKTYHEYGLKHLCLLGILVLYQLLGVAGYIRNWLHIMKKTYHEYGLKHLCLLGILVLYQFLGAAVFYLCEIGAEESLEDNWQVDIATNRTVFARRLFAALFNNTQYLYYMPPDRSDEILATISNYSHSYETQLGIKFSDQKIRWDFWSAMLYAQTICTTIGYGHLYPTTRIGRICTMIYAIFGIPLVLSILDDLGKLLTKCLKYPWFLFKCGLRRMFRYCTKQTLEEIKRIDNEDRQNLAVFDLPIPVAVFIVIAWIFICSATFTIWEEEWDYLTAFYFFFISLSTIGLGDITPSKPNYLLMMFGYIIIGLSLVSMCINLIQAKLESTYESGREDLDLLHQHNHHLDTADHSTSSDATTRYGPGLGVFRAQSIRSRGESGSPRHGRHSSQPGHYGAMRQTSASTNSRACQTLLTFPSPTRAARATLLRISRNQRNTPRNCLVSVDDVMTLVDTDDADMAVLAAMSRDVSQENHAAIAQTSCCDNNDNDQDEDNRSDVIVVAAPSDSTAAKRNTAHDPPLTNNNYTTTNTNNNTSSHPSIGRYPAFSNNKTAPSSTPSSTSHPPRLLPVPQLAEEHIVPAPPAGRVGYLPPSLPSLHDLEQMEELEDQALLEHLHPEQQPQHQQGTSGAALTLSGGGISSYIGSPSVHFRSRLSLIPEHQVLIHDATSGTMAALTPAPEATRSHAGRGDAPAPQDANEEDDEESTSTGAAHPLPETIVEVTEEDDDPTDNSAPGDDDARHPTDCDEYSDLSPRTDSPRTVFSRRKEPRPRSAAGGSSDEDGNASSASSGGGGRRLGKMLGKLLKVKTQLAKTPPPHVDTSTL